MYFQLQRTGNMGTLKTFLSHYIVTFFQVTYLCKQEIQIPKQVFTFTLLTLVGKLFCQTN
ncbi:CLUMA_CG019402, isoform A [Clunio marinus]|uniref:CLUMA_CG019402, isoform A n=1 Tax=Clunio marinus TaxID=568069 RepID=A0A1J1J082_9DIPT|nr:CLUMA_CG019402, isoform A [Clunio marinus]